ncbi:unnamed protein product, partial [marine sediment metagenome]
IRMRDAGDQVRTALVSAPHNLSGVIETYSPTQECLAMWLVDEEVGPLAPSKCAARYVTPDKSYCSWEDNSDDEEGFRVEYQKV